MNALGSLDQPFGAGRIVRRPLGLVRPHGLRVEQRQIRRVPGPDQPPALEPVDGRHVEGELVNRLFQRHKTPLAHPQPQQRRAVAEVGAVHYVGAGIRCAHQDIRAAQDLSHGFGIPARVGVLEGGQQTLIQ